MDDIDLYSGALTETQVRGGLVGETYACLLAKQFANLRNCDRFWWETKDPVTGFESGNDSDNLLLLLLLLRLRLLLLLLTRRRKCTPCFSLPFSILFTSDCGHLPPVSPPPPFSSLSFRGNIGFVQQCYLLNYHYSLIFTL